MTAHVVPLYALAATGRGHVAACWTCRVAPSSATSHGLRLLIDSHTSRPGAHHVVEADPIPAPKGTGDAGGLTAPTREAVPS